MKSDMDTRWRRIVSAARKAPAKPEPEMPPGFSTRVVAHWKSNPTQSLFATWKRLSLRVLAFGCLVMVASMLASHGEIRDTLSSVNPDVSQSVAELTQSQIEEVWMP